MVKISQEAEMADYKIKKGIKSLFNWWPAALSVSSKPKPTAHLDGSREFRHLFSWSYDGEKNLGEIGPIIDYRPNFPLLRLRSWQSYLESEISQTIVKKFALWVVGSGLKLQSEPAAEVLKSENITIEPEQFNDQVESRFGLFAKSKSSDYSNMEGLHAKANSAFLNAIIGGDVLVVLRLIDDQVKVQLIDGGHVQSPGFGHDFLKDSKANGTRIRNGIEINKKGEHIAFFIRTSFSKFERIEAKGKESNLTMAFLVYGLKYRLDYYRGMPLISVVLETLKKMDRYKEATVGSAEERQKIAYFIEHGVNSTGENPLLKQLARASDAGAESDSDLPRDVNNTQLAETVAASTNKMVFNMPQDSMMKSLESKNELHFKDFYGVNVDLIAAALEIPPEVAMSKYDSNFSASRAALKDWEHTLNVSRANFSSTFYQNVYDFWLQIQILQNKIEAPGYLKAVQQNDIMVLDAYRNARWVGASVPHIDPEKEVKAERLKLGDSGASIPLTTAEAATEHLNGGDLSSNMEQYAKELEESKKLDILAPDSPPENPIDPDTEDD